MREGNEHGFAGVAQEYYDHFSRTAGTYGRAYWNGYATMRNGDSMVLMRLDAVVGIFRPNAMQLTINSQIDRKDQLRRWAPSAPLHGLDWQAFKRMPGLGDTYTLCLYRDGHEDPRSRIDGIARSVTVYNDGYWYTADKAATVDNKKLKEVKALCRERLLAAAVTAKMLGVKPYSEHRTETRDDAVVSALAKDNAETLYHVWWLHGPDSEDGIRRFLNRAKVKLVDAFECYAA